MQMNCTAIHFLESYTMYTATWEALMARITQGRPFSVVSQRIKYIHFVIYYGTLKRSQGDF